MGGRGEGGGRTSSNKHRGLGRVKETYQDTSWSVREVSTTSLRLHSLDVPWATASYFLFFYCVEGTCAMIFHYADSVAH